MKKLKKIIWIVLFVIVGSTLLYIGINLFDQSPRENYFTMEDFPKAPLDKTNGFYVIWGLAEPDGVDVLSDQYIMEVRRQNEPLPKEEQKQKGSVYPSRENYKKKFGRFNKWITEIRFPRDITDDFIKVVTPQAEAIEKAKENCAVLLKRYRLAIDTPVIADFCGPQPWAPIPNLLAWLRTSNLFVAVHTLDAVNGNWEGAAGQLLDHLDFGKRAHAGTRVMINQLIAKAVIYRTLEALTSIMNHPQCPPEVYQLVLSRMPPIKYEEYGNRNAFMMECLYGFAIVDSPFEAKLQFDEVPQAKLLPTAIFLQRNRTKNYFFDLATVMIAYDEQPPYKWKGDPYTETEKRLAVKGSFWWIQNPIGKIIFSIAVPNIGNVIYKGHRLRATYDMTRILAEFHSKHTPGGDVKTTLDQLEAMKTIDQCSGKPYLYSAEKKCLYSVSIDGKDDGGLYNRTKAMGIDIPVPLVPKKPADDTSKDKTKKGTKSTKKKNSSI